MFSRGRFYRRIKINRKLWILCGTEKDRPLHCRMQNCMLLWPAAAPLIPSDDHQETRRMQASRVLIFLFFLCHFQLWRMKNPRSGCKNMCRLIIAVISFNHPRGSRGVQSGRVEIGTITIGLKRSF